jgi:hypothetical protein
MGHRIDKVVVAIAAYVEFEGPVTWSFEFVPDASDQPLVDALLAKNDALNLEKAKLAGKADPMDTPIT